MEQANTSFSTGGNAGYQTSIHIENNSASNTLNAESFTILTPALYALIIFILAMFAKRLSPGNKYSKLFISRKRRAYPAIPLPEYN